MKNHTEKSNKLLLSIIISIALIILLGIGTGIWYNNLPENNPQRDQSSCEKSGGEWVAGQSLCLISNRVAGEECTDGGQCQSGVCFPTKLTDEQQAALVDGEVSGISGTCYPEELIKGCVQQVLKGKVTKESLCIDE
ncbi:hypothetical protein KKG41_00135 [Patescibacteria group bacterium]|nr:hypothetical protein [Patescibacteria group bacterium]MBU1890556.1 hypothetical protein [Patescibacteria group bacterium]